MKTVSKSELKAKMLEYFRDVERTGEELIILDHRVPVLKVVPLRARRNPAEVFADCRAKVQFHEDPATPTVDEWGEV